MSYFSLLQSSRSYTSSCIYILPPRLFLWAILLGFIFTGSTHYHKYFSMPWEKSCGGKFKQRQNNTFNLFLTDFKSGVKISSLKIGFLVSVVFLSNKMFTIFSIFDVFRWAYILQFVINHSSPLILHLTFVYYFWYLLAH